MERLALDRWSSPWLRHQHVARYQWSAALATGARVLDAACGTAYGSRLMKDAGASLVTSADLSKDAFVAARRRASTKDIQMVQADVCAVPFATDSFDLYTCFETVEHVEDDRALLAEAKRVVAAGGTFLCSTPNRQLLSPGNTIHDRPANPYHVREYSIDEFRSLLEEVFDSVVLFGQTWFSHGHRDRLAKAGRLGNRYAIRWHQLRNIAGLPWEGAHRHEPRPLDDDGVPEVVIAQCRGRTRQPVS